VRDAVDAFVPATIGMRADGEVVWSWPPDAEVKRARHDDLARDGGKKARFPGESAK